MPDTQSESRRARLRAAEQRLGAWGPPHNIYLGDGVWTITDRQQVENSKLRRVIQLVADVAKRPISELRVLDLACEGGIHGVELARLGADVVAVEGRAAHVERARFVAQELGLARFTIEQADVRHVTRDSHGGFDVVLCLGILYHLDAPDVFDFVHAIAAMTDQFAIIDTSVSLSAAESRRHRSSEYWGRVFNEHGRRASRDEKLANLRASIDNRDSFWLTKPSLFNLLSHAGFTSVLETRVPRPVERYEDNVTLLANRGTHQDVPANPELTDPPIGWPERERLSRDLSQTGRARVAQVIRERFHR